MPSESLNEIEEQSDDVETPSEDESPTLTVHHPEGPDQAESPSQPTSEAADGEDADGEDRETEAGGVEDGEVIDELTLLELLDRRQNEVLIQLDDLNTRIEALIHDWTSQNRVEDEAETDAGVERAA